MNTKSLSTALLEGEARGLLARLDQVHPLALNETMVPAATLPPRASYAAERFLHQGRKLLRAQVREYLAWLAGPGGRAAPAEQQSRFVAIRMRFNAILSQFDLITEVVTQRSESRTGVWLSGLDVLAADALAASPLITDPPPMVCYLARGPGAAIRRARTRLPGGDPNPISIIRIPRERMVGAVGLSSSLVHEVGHQGAAQLGLVETLRKDLLSRSPTDVAQAAVWRQFSGWVSEIIADLWSVAMLGISATQGMLAVVSLPRFFVFRPSGDDPHPIPYLRVLISCAMGQALYPDDQWARLARTWKLLYPASELPPARQKEFAEFETAVPALVAAMLDHRSASLGNRPLRDAFPVAQRQPARLLALHGAWANDLGVMARQPPSLVFAALGQARVRGQLSPEGESSLIGILLRAWALRSTLASSEQLTTRAPARAS